MSDKTVVSHLEWECPFFSVRRYEVDGDKSHPWYGVERPNPNVVHIFAVTDDGEILLIEQDRLPVHNRVLSLPAGLVDKDESPEEAAKRELLEETGYEASEMVFYGDHPNSSGISNEISHMFIAHGLIKRTDKIGVDDEKLTLHKVGLGELPTFLDRKYNNGIYVSMKIPYMLFIFHAARLQCK